MAGKDPLRSANEAASVAFVSAQLDLALTFCRIARTARPTDHKQRSLKSARKAYNNALRYMFKLKMSHPEFDQITARAERLKLELESLEI